jgi:outer membrane lipoprotein-sorting protein
MNALSTDEVPSTWRLFRRRGLRWLVPACAAGIVALVAVSVLSADANPNLPEQSAAQLLAEIRTTRIAALSGTLVEKASLGLPESLLTGSSPSTGMLGLLTGTHTIRVWYAGETKQRVAVLDTLGEQDIFRNGRDIWQWNSNDHVATHSVLPLQSEVAMAPDSTSTLTPAEAAEQALAMIDPTTMVTTERTGRVANRPAYTLVLAPRDARSRIGRVRISVDGATKVPLGVQVFARDLDTPAIDVSFTRIDFAVPDDGNFTFVPPAGALIKQGSAPARGREPTARTETSGHGWLRVFKLTGVGSFSDISKRGKDFGLMISALPEVKGNWGTGRLFRSALVSGLITSDGTIYAGAVDPNLIYAAATKK